LGRSVLRVLFLKRNVIIFCGVSEQCGVVLMSAFSNNQAPHQYDNDGKMVTDIGHSPWTDTDGDGEQADQRAQEGKGLARKEMTPWLRPNTVPCSAKNASWIPAMMMSNGVCSSVMVFYGLEYRLNLHHRSPEQRQPGSCD
jgi:hypothetical protein